MSSTAAPSDVRQLLERWIAIADDYSRGHAIQANVLKRRNILLGIPSVIASAIVGTTIFATLQEAIQSTFGRISLASLSMFAGALSAVVTFMGYSARAASHRVSAEEYMNISRRLGVLRTQISSMSPMEWRNVLDGYSQTLENIGKRAEIVDIQVMPPIGFPQELETLYQVSTQDRPL